MLARIARRVAMLPGCIPGYTRTVRRLRSHLLAVVMYHGVVEQPLPVFNWCQLNTTWFDEHIRFLAAEYSLLPLREAVLRMKRGAPLPERAAVITFDDGFHNVYTTAFPVLRRYQVPFTVFLITGLVGGNEPTWPERLFVAISATARTTLSLDSREWPLATPQQRARAYNAAVARLKKMPVARKDADMEQLLAQLQAPQAADPAFTLMNWEEIAALSRSGLADFGSHTHTHPILSRCDPVRQESELRKSRDILRERLGNGDLFAYPNGTREDFTDATKRLLRELDYGCALTTIPRLHHPRSDIYEIGRVNVGADASPSNFELLMLGL